MSPLDAVALYGNNTDLILDLSFFSTGYTKQAFRCQTHSFFPFFCGSL